MRIYAVTVSLVLLATISLVGCGHYTCGTTFGNGSCSSSGGGTGGGVTGGQGGTYLFIADAGGVQGEVLDAASGTMKLTGNTTVSATAVPGDWMVVTGQKYMYVGYTSIGQIYGWAVNGDGTLTAITGAPFAAAYLTGDSSAFAPQAMIANPAGTLLFAADQVTDQVNVYQIGAGGALTLASGSPVTLPSGFKPWNMAVDGLGKYLYVSNNTGSGIGGGITSQVAAFSIGSSGTLTAVSGSPFASNIVQMQGESSGKYMVGITSWVSNSSNLYVMTIGSTGTLTQAQFATTNVPASLAVQPSSGGTLVYSFSLPGSGGDISIEGYTINLSTGALTAISGSPFTATGLNAQFDQTGQYLYVLESTNGNPSAVAAYNVSTSSSLTTPIASVGWAQGAWSPATVP